VFKIHVMYYLMHMLSI